MKQYLSLLEDIMQNGDDRMDRTGVGTRAVFGRQLRFDLSKGFPAVTTKKLAFKQVKAELLWMISGSSDVKELQDLGCHIWDANANADYWKPRAQFEGDLGRIYGVQWRSWIDHEGKKIDQLSEAIEKIKNNPYDRRIIVSAWNVGEIDIMALPPCPILYQFFVSRGKLSIQVYQRSADTFLGVPFDFAAYALLVSMVAQVTGLEVGDYVHTFGDVHIYKNHFDQVQEQLKRKPYKLPKLWLNPEIKDIDEFTMKDIKLVDYKYHPKIKAKMAV